MQAATAGAFGCALQVKPVSADMGKGYALPGKEEVKAIYLQTALKKPSLDSFLKTCAVP